MQKTILALCACLPFSALAVEFNSPSGNILCSGDEFEMGSVSCFIQDMTINSLPDLDQEIVSLIGGKILR